MIRRPRIETKINHERWLVSYADFVTLLFAFFVVMYSVSQVNESKYRTLSATLQSVFPSKTLGDEITREGQASFGLGSLDNIFAELDGKSAEFIESTGLKTRGNEQWVEIELDANLLFTSGQADLNPSANKALNSVAETLLQHSNAISVEGHTDNVPISNERYDNNWQLSAARAVSVLNYLALQGVNPRQLSAVGHGEHRPVADNATLAGREKNRRVVIRIAKHGAPLDDTYPNANDSSNASPLGLENSASELSSSSVQGDAASILGASAGADSDTDTIEAVRLEGGGLLFSSDPDLPRRNSPISEAPEDRGREPAPQE